MRDPRVFYLQRAGPCGAGVEVGGVAGEGAGAKAGAEEGSDESLPTRQCMGMRHRMRMLLDASG